MSARALRRPLPLLALLALTGTLGACSYMPQLKSLQDVKLFNRTASTPEVLAPVKDRPFVVFHDAYQYFEHRYQVKVAGSITSRPVRHPDSAAPASDRSVRRPA